MFKRKISAFLWFNGKARGPGPMSNLSDLQGLRRKVQGVVLGARRLTAAFGAAAA